ncbi:hypothetical protein VUR80DRAFT_7607 [Thermomyces stellatus]
MPQVRLSSGCDSPRPTSHPPIQHPLGILTLTLPFRRRPLTPIDRFCGWTIPVLYATTPRIRINIYTKPCPTPSLAAPGHCSRPGVGNAELAPLSRWTE